MITISLLNLLRTGEFGPIKSGMNKEQIKSVLGVPDDIARLSRNKRKESFWVYGIFEFYFDEETDMISSIFTDHYDWNISSDKLNFNFDELNFGTKLEDAENILKNYHIENKRDHSLSKYNEFRTLGLFFSSGVKCGFFIEKGECNDFIGLFSISIEFQLPKRE